MVVAQQMQHGVDGQKGYLPLQRMPIQIRLLHGTLHANDNIAQHHAAVILIDIILAILAQRKAQHIGGHGLVAVLVIQLGNGSVVHKGNADLGGAVEMLIFQHGIAGTADEDAEPRGHLDSFLGVGDQNFVGHIGPLLSKGYLKFFLFSLFSASAAGWAARS